MSKPKVESDVKDLWDIVGACVRGMDVDKHRGIVYYMLCSAGLIEFDESRNKWRKTKMGKDIIKKVKCLDERN